MKEPRAEQPDSRTDCLNYVQHRLSAERRREERKGEERRGEERRGEESRAEGRRGDWKSRGKDSQASALPCPANLPVWRPALEEAPHEADSTVNQTDGSAVTDMLSGVGGHVSCCRP